MSGEALPCSGIVNYDCLRALVTKMVSGNCGRPRWLLRKARIAAAMQQVNAFRPLPHSQVLNWLDDSSGGPLLAITWSSSGFRTLSITPTSRSKSGWLNESGELICLGGALVAFVVEKFFFRNVPVPLDTGILWGAAANTPLPHSAVSERLRNAKVGDCVRVLWSLEGGDVSAWTGVLTKKGAKAWSITYDRGTFVERGIIPNPEVDYFMVEVNPISFTDAAPLAPPSPPATSTTSSPQAPSLPNPPPPTLAAAVPKNSSAPVVIRPLKRTPQQNGPGLTTSPSPIGESAPPPVRVRRGECRP